MGPGRLLTHWIRGNAIKKSTASGDKIDWKMMDEKEMKEELGKGKLYGALVVPADFTSATTALTSARWARN
ncbi:MULTISPECIES: hypothetical protein [Streptomyces]|uniref:hypothetical protein n=1 Tax=Streptomyces TaxID=1883 RepID=UPI00368177AE